MVERDGDRLDGVELLEQISEIARDLVDTTGVDATLQRIVDLSQTFLTTCDDASLLLGGRAGLHTAAATSTIARELDRAQEELGKGPCVSALFEHETVVIDDLATDERWPGWTETAIESGFGSMAGVRLFVEGETMGALNLFSIKTHGFDRRSIAIARVLATHAAVALRSAITEQGLERALRSRDAIGQAKGILMERELLTGQQAFARLVQLSNRRNQRLVEVAEELAQTGQLPA